MNHPPIPISELAEHTELLKANDNLKLSQEYEVSGTKVQGSKGCAAGVLISVRLHFHWGRLLSLRGNVCFFSFKSFLQTC